MKEQDVIIIDDPNPTNEHTVVIPVARFDLDWVQPLVGTGHFFGGITIKKNGELRTFRARTGVTKHLKGGQIGYDTDKKNYLRVWDSIAKGYRIVNLNTTKSLTINKIKYVIEDES